MSGKEWVRFSLLGLIWGTSFLWIKIAVAEVSPLVLVGFRTLFGAASLVIIFVLTRNADFNWKTLRPWLGVFSVVALINIAIPFVVISWSEQFISSGIASILNSSVPLFTMLMAPLFLKDDRWTLPKFLGLAIGFIGIVVIFLPELGQGLNQNLIGMAGMLLAALSYALAGIYSRRYARGLAPQMQSFLQLALASLMVWTVTLLFDRPLVLPQQPITWLALLWLGILGSGLAYILFFSLLHAIGPTRTTTVTYIPPLVGVLLGMVFLGESITWMSILGGLLVIFGLVVVNMKELPRLKFEKPAAVIEEEIIK
ncbi:MAG: EamA family transporter [Anaerolineae bacterium]|nr:EamA family transporter [Anaerolineae bacterium]